MKKYPFLIFLALSSFLLTNAQNPIPDGDFENWTANPISGFEEPASGWWATLNPLSSLGGPVTVEKSADAHSGSFSAILTTKQYGTLLLPGIMLSGDFDVLGAAFTRGQPYTDRPTNFKGWYKYAPASGDSAAIAIQLMKWNAATQQRDTIGEVGLVIYQTVSNWTQFDMSIDYFSQDQPDSMVVVATSSAGADQFLGQIGSQLWIDDFSVDFATSIADELPELDITLGLGKQWLVEVGQHPVHMQVMNGAGQMVLQRDLPLGKHEIENAGWSEGLYLIRFNDEMGRRLVKKVILVH